MTMTPREAMAVMAKTLWDGWCLAANGRNESCCLGNCSGDYPTHAVGCTLHEALRTAAAFQGSAVDDIMATNAELAARVRELEVRLELERGLEQQALKTRIAELEREVESTREELCVVCLSRTRKIVQ